MNQERIILEQRGKKRQSEGGELDQGDRTEDNDAQEQEEEEE